MLVSFCPFVGPFEDNVHLDPKTLFKEYDEMVYCSRYELKKDGIVYDIDFDQDQVILKFKRLGKKVLELTIDDDDLFWIIRTKNLDKEGKMVFKKFVNSLDYLFIFPYYIFFFDFLKTYNGTVINCQGYSIEQSLFKELNNPMDPKEFLDRLKNERLVPVSMALDNDLVIDGSIGFIEFKDENSLKSFKEDVFEYFDKVYNNSKLKTEKMFDLELFSKVYGEILEKQNISYVTKIIKAILELEKITRNIGFTAKLTELMAKFIISKGELLDGIGIGNIEDKTVIMSYPILSFRDFIMPCTYETINLFKRMIK